MKLFASFSEAIREGAKLRPQAFGRHGLHDGHACAIAAGYLALGLNYWNDNVSDIYPYLQTVIKCPECAVEGAIHAHDSGGIALLAHINDAHRWSREAIADWLESEEEKLGYITVIESSSAATHPLKDECKSFSVLGG